MASRLKTLQDREAAVIGEMKSLTDTLAAENRVAFSEAETTKYNALKAQSDEVAAALSIERDIQERERRLEPIPNPAAPLPEEKAKTKVRFIRDRGALKAFGKDEEGAWRSGMFLRATLFGDQKALAMCRQHGIEMLAASTGHGENVNTAGGYIVPDEFSNAIITLRETYGIFRQQCRVWPMRSDTLTVPKRATGLTPYFMNENEDTTASQKTWDAVGLVAKKLGVLTRYSNELDEDAVISMADDLADEIAYAFALKEDQCGFTATGTSTFGGMTGAAVKINDGNHAASIFTAATGNTAFSTLDLADFHGVTGTLPLYARQNAKWYISAVGFANSMERLMWAGGGNTVSTISGGAGLSFLGFPVVLSQVLNTTTAADVSAIKLLFGDLSMAAAMGSRRGITLATTRDRYFEFDQVGILGTERFDINVHSLGDGTTAGPLVALKTPAS